MKFYETGMKNVLLSWSSGKDSAWTLKVLREDSDVNIVGLLTTLNTQADRVAMHAVRRELLRAQSKAAGLPLTEVELPWPCSNDDYERLMSEATSRAKAEGVTHIAFGDLFLDDIRKYREDNLQGTGIEPLFPLWGLNTSALAAEMVAGGLRAYLTCVDPRQLDADYAAREYNAKLLDDLPDGVDPCGENGEFHTFVFDGPMFSQPIDVNPGEIIKRDGFVFADITPTS